MALAGDNSMLRSIDGTQDDALWMNNLMGNKNDSQLAAILDIYNNFHGEDDTVSRRVMSD